MLAGPFAETKEALGGYFIVNCSEAEALEYAARIPVDGRPWVDVRLVPTLREHWACVRSG